MLTIAIPTYNRACDLSVLLSEIVGQLDDVPSNFVDLLISDNASTDDTQNVVLRYKRALEGHVNVLYRRNDVNFGFSRNVDLAVRDSHGEFVLIMGDDDGLETGTLAYVWELLNSHPDADVLFLGSTAYSEDLSRRLDGMNGSVGKSDLKVFQDGVQYISTHRGYPPALVSGYLVRKSAWESAKAFDFYDSISVHMLVVTRIMLRHGKVCESNRQSIKYRAGQTRTTWSQDPLCPFRFYLDELAACRLFEKETTRSIKSILYRVPTRTIAFYLIRQKITCHPFNQEKFWRCYKSNVTAFNIYTFLISLIRYMPRFLVYMVFYVILKKEILKNEL